MSRALFVESGPPQSHYVSAWSAAGFVHNATAGAEIVGTPGAGYRHYISSLVLNSEQINGMWVGISGTAGGYAVGKTYCLSGMAPTIIDFPMGMELKMPAANSGIALIFDSSGTVNYTITGYRMLD